ncbi:MAG: M48 family metallopeptidase, partial [Terracoccus sp.]
AARDPDALQFVIAHEVGHIAAGHTSYWRMLGTFASQWIPLLGSTLSRAQEYTADNYGHALVPQGARGAMATLAGGKYLNRSIDVDAMADRAIVEPGFFVWVANATASHPVLVWRMHALRDRRTPGRLLWRPKAPWLWSQPIDPTAWSLPAMIGFVPTPAPRPELPQSSAPDAERVGQSQSQPYGVNQPFGAQQEYWRNQQYGAAPPTDELPHAPAPPPDRFAPPPF